jgi:hypothetical protein
VNETAQPPPWWTDPTKNVESLVGAAVKRLDDLRSMESAHVRELLERDKNHAQQLRAAESARIDAIRGVDVAAVQRAAEVQAAQQQALAAQVTATADAQRAAMAAELGPLKIAIDDLRRAQYETQGQKQQVVETRDVRGDARLNIGAVIAAAAVVIALVTLVLYATKK